MSSTPPLPVAPRPRNAFSTLTQRGQARRLREIARQALAQYDVDVQRMTLLSYSQNAVFRVDLSDGTRRALRVCHPTWRSASDLEVELFWLRALQRDTPDIGAPLPQPNRSGALITLAGTPGVPEERRCVLFSWVPGRPPGARLTQPAVVSAIGTLVARLYAHAASLTLPGHLTVQHNDAIFTHGEVLVFDAPQFVDVLTPAPRRILEQAVATANAGYQRLRDEPAAWHLINADLWQANILLQRGVPRPVDFEDTMLGHPAQDIALLVYDLLFYAERAQQPVAPLYAAFVDGYRSVSPWPLPDRGLLTAMMLARRVWTLNWVLSHEPEGVYANATARLIARMEQLLSRDWLV